MIEIKEKIVTVKFGEKTAWRKFDPVPANMRASCAWIYILYMAHTAREKAQAPMKTKFIACIHQYLHADTYTHERAAFIYMLLYRLVQMTIAQTCRSLFKGSHSGQHKMGSPGQSGIVCRADDRRRVSKIVKCLRNRPDVSATVVKQNDLCHDLVPTPALTKA